MSICKSELLFSPVKECTGLLPTGANISVDSLDCELDGGDLLLTCQANKDNYTIAFEGSVALCSEGDSDYHDTTGESALMVTKSPCYCQIKVSWYIGDIAKIYIFQNT
jgi:hypothetical protein